MLCDPKHSSQKLSLSRSKNSGMKNSTESIFERKDVIYGMNAISHVPEPYLDPVLLIGGRRIPRTTSKNWSFKAPDDRSNNSLHNVEHCGDPETDEEMEESGSLGGDARPVPKPRARKVLSVDSDARPPAGGTTVSAPNLNGNSHAPPAVATNNGHPHAPPSRPTAQKRARSASILADGSHTPSPSLPVASTTAIDETTNYETPTPESKPRPKPPRPPPPKAALIQKYTKQADKATASIKSSSSISSPSVKGKVELRKANQDSSTPLSHSSRQTLPASRAQSTASSSSEDRGGLHDYEEVDTFLSRSQPQGVPPSKGNGRNSPPTTDTGTEQRRKTETAMPPLPPRTIPVKQKPKLLTMLHGGGLPNKPVPYRQQEDSDLHQQDRGEYSEIKDDDYTDMRPDSNPKEQGESVDTYVDIHPKSAVEDDYIMTEDDQPGSLYASSDLLANRPDLKL